MVKQIEFGMLLKKPTCDLKGGTGLCLLEILEIFTWWDVFHKYL